MHRVDGITFDCGIFTNISPDHIGPDEHADFEEYLYYKSRILNMCKVGLVNANDGHFKAVVRNASCAIHTYSVLEEGRRRQTLKHPTSGMSPVRILWALSLM